VTTLEELLTTAADNLEMLQGERLRVGNLDNFYRCRDVIAKLRNIVGYSENNDDDGDGDDDDGDDDDDDSRSSINGGNRDAKTMDKELMIPFTIMLDDPTGNSFFETNPHHAPHRDPNTTRKQYNRMTATTQDMEMGVHPPKERMKANYVGDSVPSPTTANTRDDGSSHQYHAIEIEEERILKLSDTTADETIMTSQLMRDEETSMKFSTNCPHCGAPSETIMRVTDIPHFKEAIIMSLSCEHCGYKSNEIKGGGAIPSFGTKITLRVKDSRDLAREVLKSDTAGIVVPELDLELEEGGGMNGVYTTVEGLMKKMHGRLWAANPFGMGESSVVEQQHGDDEGERCCRPMPQHVKYSELLAQLKDMADGRRFPFTLILSDPLSNSFVGPVLNAADKLSLQAEKGSISCHETSDEGLRIEEFERTETQNEHLGLNDMKTKDY